MTAQQLEPGDVVRLPAGTAAFTVLAVTASGVHVQRGRRNPVLVPASTPLIRVHAR